MLENWLSHAEYHHGGEQAQNRSGQRQQHSLPQDEREHVPALRAHGLIKVRMFSDDRETREAALAALAEELNAAPVQHIGKILVVYQPQEEEPEKKPAKRKGKPLTKKQLGNR